MAGGSGTRLWPMSRKNQPKQSQPVVDGHTMVQTTWRRLRRGWPPGDIFVSTNQGHYKELRKQLQVASSRYILEPVKRDTAAAIGLVAVKLWAKDKNATFFTASSDHYFKEEREYVRLVKVMGRVLQRHPDRTILLGVKPTFPHTGLGYIQMKAQTDRIGRDDVFSVERFIEKPALSRAKQMVAGWQYLWNIGVFCVRADALLAKYQRWMPRTYRILMLIAKDIGTRREQTTIKRLFPKLEKTSIDYGIMEHDRSMLVVPGDLTWADIGSWREVYQMLAKQEGDNVLRGRHILHDSAGNLVYSYSDRLIAVAGAHDMIIVETAEAILVCPRDRAQDVKYLVTELERKGLHKLL